jgi:hypothetical protein
MVLRGRKQHFIPNRRIWMEFPAVEKYIMLASPAELDPCSVNGP